MNHHRPSEAFRSQCLLAPLMGQGKTIAYLRSGPTGLVHQAVALRQRLNGGGAWPYRDHEAREGVRPDVDRVDRRRGFVNATPQRAPSWRRLRRTHRFKRGIATSESAGDSH